MFISSGNVSALYSWYVSEHDAINRKKIYAILPINKKVLAVMFLNIYYNFILSTVIKVLKYEFKFLAKLRALVFLKLLFYYFDNDCRTKILENKKK